MKRATVPPSTLKLAPDVYGGWYIIDPGWPEHWHPDAPVYVRETAYIDAVNGRKSMRAALRKARQRIKELEASAQHQPPEGE
jgi:hypothetical protein